MPGYISYMCGAVCWVYVHGAAALHNPMRLVHLISQHHIPLRHCKGCASSLTDLNDVHGVPAWVLLGVWALLLYQGV